MITLCGFGVIIMMPIGVKHSVVHHKMKPETKIYRPKNSKILLFVLASGAAMVGEFFILIPRAPLQGWLFTAFFWILLFGLSYSINARLDRIKID